MVITGSVMLFSAIFSIGSIVLAVCPPNLGSPPKSNVDPQRYSPPEIGAYYKAAVATSAKDCSEDGKQMLLRGGSAVDAAIAALLCQGVNSPHSMGLGGGFGMTIYNATTGNAEFLDARETAPARATRNMFRNKANASRFGGLAIGVPGMLAGLWAAHQRYGKLPWAELFSTSIKLCEDGSEVNPYLESALRKKKSVFLADPNLAEVLIDPKTNSTWTTGDKIKWPKLKETMTLLAKEGIAIFYNGIMGEKIVQEIQDFGGIIEMDDFRNYKVEWKKPVTTTFGNNLTLYTSNLPGSGVLLAFIMNILDGFVPSPDENIFWQRLVETFKWAYGRRTQLGDIPPPASDDLIANLTSKINAANVRSKIRDDWTSDKSSTYGAIFETPTDAGTCHISVLASDGSAVSVTSTINQAWGALRRSPSTGILFNNQMDDFSVPNVISGYDVRPSPANYIKPGKRPLSSTVPSIIVDNEGKVQMVIGGTGGPKITTAVATTIVLNLWGGYDIRRAVEARRLHHQLFPMGILSETYFSESVKDFLINLGHKIIISNSTAVSTVNAISRFNSEKITAYSDHRRYGDTAGY